jgi:DNA-binding NtrC family response regulator
MPTPPSFILLVDDERDLIEVLREALELALPQQRVVAVTTVEEAESVLAEAEGAPSLVCVDHKLGERNGLELLESLRSRYPDTPALLLTGQAPADVEARAMALGATVLWKPIALSKWIGAVKEQLSPR